MSTNPENSPPSVIRRPFNVTDPVPINVPTTSPRENNELVSVQPTTPVLVTPVNRRSTRELIAIPRVRRNSSTVVSRRVVDRALREMNNRRRSISVNVRRVATRVPQETRNEKIETTSTAIEYDPRELEMERKLEELVLSRQPFTDHPSTVLRIPSDRSVEAELREMNRRLVMEQAEILLKRPEASQKELMEVLKMVISQAEIISAEMKTIDDAIAKNDDKHGKLIHKLESIEKILDSIDE